METQLPPSDHTEEQDPIESYPSEVQDGSSEIDNGLDCNCGVTVSCPRVNDQSNVSIRRLRMILVGAMPVAAAGIISGMILHLHVPYFRAHLYDLTC